MIPIVMGGFDLRVDFVLLSHWIKLVCSLHSGGQEEVILMFFFSLHLRNIKFPVQLIWVSHWHDSVNNEAT